MRPGSGTLATTDAVTPYVDEMAAQFQLDRRIKVVADAGNGTAGPVIHRIFEKINLDATELFFEMDGHFPNHHPDPTVPANLAHLVAKVRKPARSWASLSMATPTASARVDEHGNVIYGDLLLFIYAREILQRKPGATFIGEVKCSQVMYDQIAKLGGNGIMYKTGHSLIKAKMKEEHAELAGEMSGHMFFGDRYRGYDDALYSACRLIEIVAKSGQPLSAQLAGVPKMVSTPEIRVDCPDEIKFELVARVAEHFKKTYKTIDIDGVRVIFPEGWGLLRASNTQPVLVMRFEAANEASAEAISIRSGTGAGSVARRGSPACDPTRVPSRSLPSAVFTRRATLPHHRPPCRPPARCRDRQHHFAGRDPDSRRPYRGRWLVGHAS